MTLRTVIIIPARGGSKGIPRKNLRSLGGRPLIAYAIATALATRHDADVFVTSDDPEILTVASKLGARVHRRADALAGDAATLDEVIIGAYEEICALSGHRYDLVVTLQPTSPLLSVETLDEAIDTFVADPALETLLSGRDDTHLTWGREGERFVPRYVKRVNRQWLDPVFRETGGLIACRERTLATGSRIAHPATLLLLEGAEAIDIDSREDWALCEWYLDHGDILFVVAGFPEIGLGHAYNALTVANELVRHRIRFLVTAPSALAHDAIAAQHYEVHRQRDPDLVAEILRLQPDMVVNDRLDTPEDEIRRLKAAGITVVSFEDLGPGARLADLVVNAIYPEREPLPNHHFGPRFFCPRAEFVLTQPRPVSEEVRRVLVTFGGVDPSNLTRRVLESIHDECVARGIELHVIAGRGYAAFESLEPFGHATVDHAVADMADRIRAADLVFTSAGRTVFEVACVGTPAIVLAQNDRELTHFFASRDHGFVNLGLGADVPVPDIRATFLRLIEHAGERRRMQGRMLDNDLRSGTDRVVRLIEEALNTHVAR